jgi:excisionase family DNA binding protein
MGRVVYTVPEVAEALGISDSLAYRLIERGDIPSLRLGERRIVVPKIAIERLCESAS